MHAYRFGRHACFSVLISVFLFSPARATNYYVNCATGSNGNNGLSPSTAWQTIAYAVSRVGSLAVVTVSGGPCTISTVTFGPSLSGSGDCRTQEANCTIFRGDNPSAPTILDPATPNVDGFVVAGAAHDLKFENFSFRATGVGPFGEPFKIRSEGTSAPSRIVVKNVDIWGQHVNAGIKVISGGDGAGPALISGLVFEDVEVMANLGGGFVLDSTKPVGSTDYGQIDDVAFTECRAMYNKPLGPNGIGICTDDGAGLDEVDGFAITHKDDTRTRVTNVTFKGGQSTGNGEDGYDVIDDADHPNEESQRVEMLHLSATANCNAGIRTLRSLHVENGYVADNGAATASGGAGIRAAGEDSTLAQLNIISSTIKDNDGVQMSLDGRNLVRIRVYDTIASSASSSSGDTFRAFVYNVSGSPQSTADWDYNHFYRAGSASVGVVQVFPYPEPTPVNCTHSQIPTCQGNHPNSIGTKSDPLYASDGMHLTASSPGWNRGGQPSQISGIGIIEADAWDRAGASRPQGGAYDMGAFEGEGDGGGGCY